MLSMRHCKYKETNVLNVKGQKKTDTKMALLYFKIKFKTKHINKDKYEHFIMIKGSMDQQLIAFIAYCVSDKNSFKIQGTSEN